MNIMMLLPVVAFFCVLTHASEDKGTHEHPPFPGEFIQYQSQCEYMLESFTGYIGVYHKNKSEGWVDFIVLIENGSDMEISPVYSPSARFLVISGGGMRFSTEFQPCVIIVKGERITQLKYADYASGSVPRTDEEAKKLLASLIDGLERTVWN